MAHKLGRTEAAVSARLHHQKAGYREDGIGLCASPELSFAWLPHGTITHEDIQSLTTPHLASARWGPFLLAAHEPRDPAILRHPRLRHLALILSLPGLDFIPKQFSFVGQRGRALPPLSYSADG